MTASPASPAGPSASRRGRSTAYAAKSGIPVACPAAMHALFRFPLVELPVVFTVIGEHRDDPTCLRLLGDDGQHYAWRLLDGVVMAIAPDDAWRVDGARLPLDALTGSALGPPPGMPLAKWPRPPRLSRGGTNHEDGKGVEHERPRAD